MDEFVIAIGLVLVIEGVLYALFPEGMQRMMAMALTQPSRTLRVTGMIAAFLGFAVVWTIKH